jgi:hypothetical protein
MSRGTELTVLVDMLRSEMGHTIVRSAGVQNLENLKQVLSRVEQILWAQFDWPFGYIVETLQLEPGAAYYDYTENIDFTRVVDIWHVDQSTRIAHKLDYGIDPTHYMASMDRQNPVLRWRHQGTARLEIWPPPISDTQVLMIYGIQRLANMVNDTDLCTLDDQLIVLHAAAELLERQGSPDAGAKAATAAAHFRALKSKASSAKQEPWKFGAGDVRPRLRPGIDYVSRHG